MVFLHWYFIRPDNSEHLQWTSLIGTLGRRLIKQQQQQQQGATLRGTLHGLKRSKKYIYYMAESMRGQD